MTEDRLPLAELLAKAGDGDFLRSVAEAVVQLLMETDVDGLIGAGRHERTGERTTYRRYHDVPAAQQPLFLGGAHGAVSNDRRGRGGNGRAGRDRAQQDHLATRDL